MNAHYPVVADRAGHRCEYCRAPESAFNLEFEVEHIHPSGAGGKNIPANLALACRSCNSFKATRRQAIDPESVQSVRLFNPRQDQWTEHFVVDVETFEIRGLTPIGRATIVARRLNSPA